MKRLFFALTLLLISLPITAAPPVFSPKDRILILAPHPDDEILGCGGIIQEALAHHLPVRIVFLTYGDNNEWSFLVYRHRPVFFPQTARAMGLIRHDEAVAAARVLGLRPDHLTFLGYPDFETLNLWQYHWGAALPGESMLTRVRAVPYANAYRPGAPYKGEAILADLEAILKDYRPTQVFVSHPGDHNPDHRALYLYLRIALWDLSKELSPKIHPFLIHYHLRGWPSPEGYHPDLPLEPPSFFKSIVNWQTIPLTSGEVAQKEAALKEHKTQFLYSGHFLSSFVRTNEMFGDFPALDLRVSSGTVSMHEGPSEPPELPDELTDREKAGFVGFEERHLRREGNDLIFTIDLTRPMGESVEVWLSAFGYRHDQPFATMPKIRVQFGYLRRRVYDQQSRITDPRIQMIRRNRELIVRMPLELLGGPEKLLTSVRVTIGGVPLDWMSWRIVELSHP